MDVGARKGRSGRRVHPVPGRLDEGATAEKRRLKKRSLRVVVERAPSVLPATTEECRGGPRPCPLISCPMHLWSDVTRTGGLKLNFPDREPWEMPEHESCAVDVADAGGATLDRVGVLINLTRERVRQLQEMALGRFLAELKARGLEGALREWLGERVAKAGIFDEEMSETGGSGGGEPAEPYERVGAVARLPKIADPGVSDAQYAGAIWRLYLEKTGGSAASKEGLEPVPGGG